MLKRNGRSAKVPYLLGLAAAMAVFAVFLVSGCGAGDTPEHEAVETTAAGDAMVKRPPLSGTAMKGEELFNANCAACHGLNAAGTGQGPTLIDRVYHPGHHQDSSLRNAIRNGVPQHHWWFGDMPPVTSVSEDEAEKIICYVREIQRGNGVFEGDAFSTVC